MAQKRTRGRPEWKPSRLDRERVRMMAAIGLPRGRIASALNIDERTLLKHCGQEIEHGADAANLAVAKSLFRMATAGQASFVKLGAAKFWLASRAGWRDTAILITPLSEMSSEEIAARLELDDTERAHCLRQASPATAIRSFALTQCLRVATPLALIRLTIWGRARSHHAARRRTSPAT